METLLVIGVYLCFLTLLIATLLFRFYARQKNRMLNNLLEAEFLTRKSITDTLQTVTNSIDKISDALQTQLLKEHRNEHLELLEKVKALQQAVEKVDTTLNETLTLD